MFDRPRDLAAMEATCRSWRKTLIEGNDVLDFGAADGKRDDDTKTDACTEKEGDHKASFPCPWKLLTLKRFPRIKIILERRSKKKLSTHSNEEVIMTWKSLYREQRYFEE